MTLEIERAEKVPPKRDKYGQVFDEAIAAADTDEPVVSFTTEGSASNVAHYMRQHERAGDFTITSRGDTIYVEHTP